MKMFAIVALAAAAGLAGMAAAQDQGGPGSGAGGPMAAVRKACAADLEKFCPGKTGPERRRCVMENHEKFTPDCQSALSAMMRRWQEQRANEGATPK